MITKKIRYQANKLKKNQIVLDIETTGLSSLYDKVVVLGLIGYENKTSYIIQYFAENDLEEKRLLEIFLKKSFDKQIITYNGDSFDLPFLKTRLKAYKLQDNIVYKGIDIYKIIRSKKHLIDFYSMKLVDIEKLIDINRNDPSRYKSVSKLTKEIKKRENPRPILIHNQNDLIATEKLIDIDLIIKNMLSLTANNYTFYLLDISISNNIAKVILESSNELVESYFTKKNYQLQTKARQIIIYFTVLYGKISPNIGGYVSKNIFNLKDSSNYKINPNLLVIKEGKMYNTKNILNYSLAIIKENLNL
ncbi:MAG: ribonuclease H-like domain-containing protein [Peptoniphilaceae bacterium]|nr:ribonuclease H-like domain-containing protein [Peptoniphilaceae bacterium]MDY6019588.1 ribonuclease H-like domain-containing protein [Anaerococcus sp.]